MSGAADEGSQPRVSFGRRLLRLAAGFAGWTGLGVFFASQLVLAGLPWTAALGLTMPRWYSWGLVAPLVFWLDRRLASGSRVAARVALHVPAGVLVTLLAISLRLISRPIRGAPWPPDVLVFFLERFSWELFIYAAIAAAAISTDYARQARVQERRAHALAVERASLEHRLAEARLQSLRNQLHPHFLFNALNTISALTETSPATARRLMGQLGDLLRASLTHSSQPLVTLAEELTLLDDYLAIESARFEDHLEVVVDADEQAIQLPVPGFVLQPLVENAIRHGVAPRLARGRVDVSATLRNGSLRLAVRDDGVGLPDGWALATHAGVGLSNVAARLEHLYGRRDLLRVTRRPSGGVEAEVEVPAAPSSGRGVIDLPGRPA